MNLQVLELIVLVFILLYVLVRSVDLIEKAFVYLAKKLSISEFFVGFVILSIISSLPEFSIALNSNNTIPALSVGNLTGATLILITLVVGVTVIKFKNIEFKKHFGELEILTGLCVILLSSITLIDGTLSFLEGLVLISAYGIYLLHLYEKFHTSGLAANIVKEIRFDSKNLIRMLVEIFAGSFLILFTSSLIVDAVLALGHKVEINEALVGLFVLAIGTNLPEMTVLIRAKSGSQKQLAIGNVIGSAAINTLILGTLAILSQGVVLNASDFKAIAPVLALTIFAMILFGIFSWTGRKLTRVEGILLVGIYVSLIVAEIIAVTTGAF